MWRWPSVGVLGTYMQSTPHQQCEQPIRVTLHAGDVPFDLLHASEECKPLQLSRLREVAELKDRRWAVLLAQASATSCSLAVHKLV